MTLQCLLKICNRNLRISRAPLKCQAYKGTSLLTSTATNQMVEGSP